MKKTIVGIVALVLGVAAGVTVFVEIGKYLPASGAAAGKIHGYRPPYPAHGIWMVALIAVSLFLLLLGIAFIVVGLQQSRSFRRLR